MQQHYENEDIMSPAMSPGEASGRSGVRRVNNLPLFLVGGATLTFLVIMVLVAADRAAKQNRAGDETEKAKVVNTSMAAHEIAGNYTQRHHTDSNEAFGYSPATYGFRSTGLDRGQANQPGCAATTAEPHQSTEPTAHAGRGFGRADPAS